jgi:hypothetical protein
MARESATLVPAKAQTPPSAGPFSLARGESCEPSMKRAGVLLADDHVLSRKR